MARAPSRSEGIYAFASYAVPNLVRNAASPEAWRVVRMEAILPHEREAGLPGRVNLLQEPEPRGGILETQGKKEWGEGEDARVVVADRAVVRTRCERVTLRRSIRRAQID